MQSEQKPTYICRNAKEALKLSQQLNSNIKTNTLKRFVENLVKKTPKIEMPYRLLNGIEEKLVWERSIKQYRKSSLDLSHIENLSEIAIKANQLISQFNISENAIKSEERTEEHSFFNAWRLIFTKYCEDRGAITLHDLLKIVTKHIQNRDITIEFSLVFVGFEFLTPDEAMFIEACKSQADVSFFKAQKIESNINSLIHLNEEHECLQVVEWCKKQIENDRKVLIVTPQLDRIIDRLTSLLDKAFHPESFTPSLSHEKRIYQFSLNIPLFHLSTIYLNLKLIELGARGISSVREIKNILTQGCWSDSQEIYQRYKIIGDLESKRRGNISISDLIEMIEFNQNFKAPLLTKHLNLIKNAQLEWRSKRMPSVWIDVFNIYLKNIQSTLFIPKDSYEEIVYESWEKITSAVAALDALMGEVSIQDISNVLEYYFKKNTYQNQYQDDIKIDILGFHETTYKIYDATWIMNLNEQHWPSTEQYNPFIPIKIQHENHINDHQKHRIQATKILGDFTQTAPFVTMSYAKKMGDEVIFPSPILHTFLSSKPHEELNFDYKNNDENQHFIEYIEDSTSIKIDTDRDIKSGIKLLDAQSICPAWAFYEFRLGAKKLDDDDEENLTTRLRGNLFHKILEQFWTTYKLSSLVSSLSENELSNKIQNLTRKVISSEREKYPRIMPEFFNIEEIRMINYIEKWVKFELQRGDFEVKETEKKITLKLSHLNFNIKIDRIDSVNQNGIVIDYKSGTSKPLKEWFLSGSGELQMPLYAIYALHTPIDLIAIGMINTTKPQWVGIGRDTDIIRGVKAFSSLTQYQTWELLVEYWKTRVNEAVSSYEKGEASVKFECEQDLSHCNVKSILRLPERTLQFEQTKQ